MINMNFLAILILSVTMTMASDDHGSVLGTEVDEMRGTSSDNGSMVGTGDDRHVYNLTTNCSVSVSASDIEEYHGVVAKATKLVYVHFYYNETQWDVIKVLDEKSKYLLALGDYETYLMLSLHTLSFGIEHTSVRLHQLSEGCLTKPKDLNRTLMMLVSNNFQTLCTDRQCLKSVCIKGNMSPVLCAVKYNGKYTLKEVYMNDVVLFFVLLFLISFTITLILVATIGKYMFLITSNEYHYTQNKDISILDTYLIGKQQVPSGILSSSWNFLLQRIIPLDSCFLRNTIHTQIWLRICLMSMVDSLLFFILRFSFSLHFLGRLQRIILLSSVVTLIWLLLLVMISSQYCSSEPVRSNLFPLSWILSSSCIFEHFLKDLCINKSHDRINKFFKFIFNFLSFLFFFFFIVGCFAISWYITKYLFTTLIGITTNSIPYFPLVVAGFVYYLKLSTRLSNWYKRFFEIVLDTVRSMAEGNFNETTQLSGKKCFHIVKPRSSVQMKGGQLQVTGTPIFIDETGMVMFTRSFFHKCVRLNNKHSRQNSLRLLGKCLLKLYCAILFLVLVGFIIKYFGIAGQQSTAHMSLISLASGIIPFVLENYLENYSMSIEDSNTLFEIHLKDLVNSYEESFTVAPQCNENIKGNNLTEQNGSELATMHSSSDGQEHTVESSESLTENTQEGDASEKEPLMCMNSRDVIIDIENEDESQEINSELPDDLSYIDIK